MIGTETSIREAVTDIRPRTQGVLVGSEIRVGRDSTDEEAVWVYGNYSGGPLRTVDVDAKRWA